MKTLFYISKAYSIPIITPLISWLRLHQMDYALFISEKVFQAMPRSWDKEKLFRNVQDAIDYHPEFVITPGNFVDFRLPGKKVQIFHGIGVEKPSHYKIRHFFDLYCTSGPCVTERFQKSQKRYGTFLVRETGWPKIDYILNYPVNGIKKELNIPDSKKVILYAPTQSPKMHSAADLMPVIPSIVQEDELWFVKFHELMPREQIAEWTVSVPDSVRIIQDYDITPYLHAADILISDTSSVIYEFMALNKPVITYRTLSRFDKGINIGSCEELAPAIDRCIAAPDEFKKNRADHMAQVNPVLDGNISGRLFDMLLNLKEGDWPKKKKPMNLFRRLQILYHEKFKKGYLR